MNKTKLLVLLLGLIPLSALSQRAFISNHYIYDMFLMNPADAGSNRKCYVLGGMYNQQWIGTDLAPTTQLLSFQAYMPKNTGSGTYIYNDRNGNNNRIGLQQSISVDVILRENRKGFTSIAFGLSALVEQASLRTSNFIGDGIDIDPVITGGNHNGVGFNMNAGLILKIDQYKIGASVTNLLPNNNPFFQNDEEAEIKPYTHAFASSVYKYPGRELYLEPIVYFRHYSNNDSRLDVNLKAQLPTMSEDFSFWGLIGYRRSMDQKAGKDLGIAATIGFLYKGINLGFEHEYGLTGAQSHYGSYMKLILGYKFCQSGKHKAIPCSAAGLSGIGSGELHRRNNTKNTKPKARTVQRKR